MLPLVTQLSTPKTAAVYASTIAALLPAAAPTWLILSLPPLVLSLPPLVLALETSWYAVFAVAFSAPRPRSVYLRSKTWIDRAAGAVMGALGARLLSDAVLAQT